MGLPPILHEGKLQAIKGIPGVSNLNTWGCHPANHIILRDAYEVIIPQAFDTGSYRRLEYS